MGNTVRFSSQFWEEVFGQIQKSFLFRDVFQFAPWPADCLSVILTKGRWCYPCAITKLTHKTNPVERFHCTLRHRVSRLVRATLSFSKNLANHIEAIKYFLCDDNLTRCAALPG